MRRECKTVTRMSVMLPKLPGLGVWRLDTGGWQAATTLPSTITLLAGLARGGWMHAVLRAEQRSKKERLDNGKVQTHRFVVPVLDLPGTTIGQLVDGAGLAPTPQIEAGERPTPPTAADRAAAKREQIEARRTADEPPHPALTQSAAPDPTPASASGTAGAEAPPPSAPATESEADRPGATASAQAGDGTATAAAPSSSPAAAPQCEVLSPYGGNERCGKAAGHTGVHKNRDRESWE